MKSASARQKLFSRLRTGIALNDEEKSEQIRSSSASEIRAHYFYQLSSSDPKHENLNIDVVVVSPLGTTTSTQADSVLSDW
jgi:hypothetical protein